MYVGTGYQDLTPCTKLWKRRRKRMNTNNSFIESIEEDFLSSGGWSFYPENENVAYIDITEKDVYELLDILNAAGEDQYIENTYGETKVPGTNEWSGNLREGVVGRWVRNFTTWELWHTNV